MGMVRRVGPGDLLSHLDRPIRVLSGSNFPSSGFVKTYAWLGGLTIGCKNAQPHHGYFSDSD